MPELKVENGIQNETLTKPVLSAFTDHREYLQAFYNYKRQCTKGSLRPYSYQDFSAAADIKSPNYLKLIIEGKRNLSESMMLKFARALNLQKEETVEFCALVRYSQAVDPLERNKHLRSLATLRMSRNEQSTEAPSWLHWAIKALADQKGVTFDPEVVHGLLGHRAKLNEVKEVMESLLEGGEVIRSEGGEIKKGLTPASQNKEVSAALVRKLQAELIYLGMESLFNDTPDEREFGSVTLALTHKEFEALKFELRHLRKRIYKDNLIAREKEKADQVYQLNIQLFPVSKRVE